MPFTPFHFGPGAVVHALLPRQVSFLAFCTANVLIDIEPLYFMLTRQYPLHRFFHTYIGATLIMAATIIIFSITLKLASRLQLPNLFQWQSLSPRSIWIGAAAGCYSHMVFDSIMHTDIVPLAPFSDVNVLYQLVSLNTLHDFCELSALAALIILGVRHLQKNSPTG